jgi:hypothetical protein
MYSPAARCPHCAGGAIQIGHKLRRGRGRMEVEGGVRLRVTRRGRELSPREA